MRLLNTTTFELHSGNQPTLKEEGYAILSHRWVGEEITFEQIGEYASKLIRGGQDVTEIPQLEKIRGACEIARGRGLQWMWIDTCCINKTSTVEENESIKSMFKWYRDAKLCVTYLHDVRKEDQAPPAEEGKKEIPDVFRSIVDNRKPSAWFSRGWTLQELLAPREMEFFDVDWAPLGTRNQLADAIAAVTDIAVEYLTGQKPIHSACIAVKMSWMSRRTTTREEDIAYSMLGIFEQDLVPQYGEGGARAFMRLQKALLKVSTDESLFAWRMPHAGAGAEYRQDRAEASDGWAAEEWGLLAPTPKWFIDCGNVTIRGGPSISRPPEGWKMAQQGVQISLRPLAIRYDGFLGGCLSCTIVGLIPLYIYGAYHNRWKLMKGFSYALNCWIEAPGGGFRGVQIYLRPETPPITASVLSKRMRSTQLTFSKRYNKKGIGLTTVVQQPDID